MAYECSPRGTSEWAVGWGRLLQAARVAEVHMVTSEKNYQVMEKAQRDGRLPDDVKLYTPAPDEKLRTLEQKEALFAYNYTAYEHWQRLALQLAIKLHAREQFDLVHQVNVCTFREPGYTWELGIPYVWGPVGGSQNFPWRFLAMLPAKEMMKEGVRGLSNWISLRYKARVRTAANKAAVLLAANSTNQRDYANVFSRPVELLLETGLFEVNEPDRTRFVERITDQKTGRGGRPLRLLWVGELVTRKALPVLLRALTHLGEDVPVEVIVVGEGPLRRSWQTQAQRLGVAGRVTFRGEVTFAEVQTEFERADLFCFTSLRDTSGNVVLEALAAGVPVLCFDHQGARDMVSESSGVKIPASSPGVAVRAWATAIGELAGDAERLCCLSQGATEQARKFLWDDNGNRVNAIYRKLAGV